MSLAYHFGMALNFYIWTFNSYTISNERSLWTTL